MSMSTPKDRVVDSINNAFADRCVDFVIRPDGSFGYKQFRRDPEDQGAWFVTDLNATGVYPTLDDAMAAAVADVGWLEEALQRVRKPDRR